MYQLDAVSPRLQQFIRYNPMLYFIELFRAPIYHSQLPDVHAIAFCIIFSSVALIAGLKIFRAYEHKLIFRL